MAELRIIERSASHGSFGPAASKRKQLRRLGHYADKNALLRAVGAEIAAGFTAEVERARAEAPPHAISQFRAIGIATLRFAVRYPAHFRVLYLPGRNRRGCASSPAIASPRARAARAG